MKFNDKITKKWYSLQMIGLKIFFVRIYSPKKTNLLPQFALFNTNAASSQKLYNMRLIIAGWR